MNWILYQTKLILYIQLKVGSEYGKMYVDHTPISTYKKTVFVKTHYLMQDKTYVYKRR